MGSLSTREGSRAGSVGITVKAQCLIDGAIGRAEYTDGCWVKAVFALSLAAKPFGERIDI
jgi:hypothetical protein